VEHDRNAHGRISRQLNMGLAITISILVTLFSTVLVLKTDNFLADDSYFYLQVAWNFAHGNGSTFNAIMPTNGYHPLWMLLCSVVYRIFPDRVPAIHAIGGLIAVLQTAALWTVRRLLLLVADDLWPVAFALLIPFCFFSQLGTEGALSGLALAVTILFSYKVSFKPTTANVAVFSFVASVAMLSRLDNVFIISFLWIALWAASARYGRKLMIVMLAIPSVLCGTYLGLNWIYFHTLQPISGLLKSHSLVDHALGANLPHTAFLALVIIAAGIPTIAFLQRDRFFLTIELPFAVGVLCHAAYIVFRMSSETRWSWYYTSWILLASILLARLAALVLARLPSLAIPASVFCILFLTGVGYKLAYKKFYLGVSPVPAASFNEVLYKRSGVRRAFAFDQPGMLAYYSDIQIVPLDGLMGNLQFQHDLATKGLKFVMESEHIDAFISAPLPVNDVNKAKMCDVIFLSTEQYHCPLQSNGERITSAVDIYARIPSKLAGTLTLNRSALLWNQSDTVSVWRINPGDVVR
jgi:hypothetical protein